MGFLKWVNIMIKCSGCGSVMQSENPKAIGYVPVEKLKKGNLCLRCFRILHYNDLITVDLPKEEEVLSIINAKGEYAFFFVDLLNINSEVISTYKKISIPKCLVISKIDYIPKSIKKENIIEWLQEVYGIDEEILFLSAIKDIHTHDLFKVLERRKVKTGYLLGYTNAGKSTLVNSLLENQQITTSILPNTTLDFLKLKFHDGFTLIDSPGFLYKYSIFTGDLSLLKRAMPKTFLKPRTYQLKKGASLIIEGRIRIFIESEECNLTVYVSNLLQIKKVYEANTMLYDLNALSFSLSRNEDFVLKELGFVTFKSDAKIKVFLNNSEEVEVRKSFFRK